MAAFTVEAVTAGMELGVFDELSAQPLAAETLADRTDADPRESRSSCERSSPWAT